MKGSIMDILEREERILQQQLDDGEIDISEYNQELREIEREDRWHAEEVAQQAHDRTLEDWGYGG